MAVQRLAALKVQPPVAARRGRAQGPHDSGTSSGRTTCQARLAHIASDLLRRRITGRGLRRRCRTGPRMQQASAPDGPARRLARRARAATSGRSRWSCSLVPPVPGARSDAPPNHPVACLAGPRVPGARPQAGATNVRPALRLSRFTTAQGLVDRLPPFQTPRSDPVGVDIREAACSTSSAVSWKIYVQALWRECAAEVTGQPCGRNHPASTPAS